MNPPTRSRSRPVLLFFAIVSATASFARAEVYLVDSIAALKAKISAAEPGDTITVKDGVYATNSAITVKRGGTAEKPSTS